MKRKETGNLGEKLARDFLKKKGYLILQTNYRSPYGEIDIIARHNDYLVFVEVRTKKSAEFGIPEESITTAKKHRLVAASTYYQQTHVDLPSSCRIDVVAVELNRRGKLSRIEVIENAVGEA